MRDVPLSYKFHVLSALALLAFSPFSRLVHIGSAPLFYLFRPPIVFRRNIDQIVYAKDFRSQATGGKER